MTAAATASGGNRPGPAAEADRSDLGRLRAETPRSNPVEYWAQVRAEGLVYGRGGAWVPYVLGTFRSISPVLAVHWVRGQALCVADRLDPDPAFSPWLPVRAAGCAGAAGHDAPSALRAWATGPGAECVARGDTRGGRAVLVTASDADCTYTLSVRPVRMSAPADGFLTEMGRAMG